MCPIEVRLSWHETAKRLGGTAAVIERNLAEINAGLPSGYSGRTVVEDTLFWTTLPQVHQWMLFNVCGLIVLIG